MPYTSSGSLTSSKLQIDDSDGWSTQADWEAYQSAQGIEIINGSVQLAETAIPASVIDNFEASDADPAGVYETGQTIADYYSGSTDRFGRTTSNVQEGATALEATNPNGNPQLVESSPGDGLNTYPSDGDTIRFIIRDPGAFPGLAVNADFSSGDVYSYSIRSADNTIRIEQRGSTAATLASANASVSQDTWYWGEADKPDANGNLSFALYEYNTSDGSRGSQIQSVSATNTDYSHDGIGALTLGATAGTILDGIEVL